jgi:cell wall-associated NlpC family hydrolase
MLSFIISNAIIVANAAMGVSPVTTEKMTVDLQNPKGIVQAQELVVTGAAQTVSRDAITVNVTPVAQYASLGSQIATQSLPASSSALVNSALKYVGYGWDCTMLVEQALRDLGYSIGDVGPMGFGSVGTVFYDPNQVQPGDIMMRGGHVAIWAGDGMSVQGGFGFGGVVYNSWEGPGSYSAFVRLG